MQLFAHIAPGKENCFVMFLSFQVPNTIFAKKEGTTELGPGCGAISSNTSL